MVFSDLLFIFIFLPLFALTYAGTTVLDHRRMRAAIAADENLSRPMLWRNLALVFFSLVFYSWGEPIYVLLMLATVLINWLCGLAISGRRGNFLRKSALTIGVALNLAILGSFKYLGFFADSLAAVGINVNLPRIALPIGISFYIFQSISYLVDVYRREAPAQRNFLDLLLYIAMFPQLIAGPIVRYDTVARQINSRSVTAEDLSEGAYRFLIGLGKKVVLANILGEVATALLAGDLVDLSMAAAWVGILAFTLQIYFDFSGYSDMAIGLGRAMGFRFNENFNHPYVCTSITDFWRRWHMSLGSFFRDYVYIPLGGNRRHQAFNILTVWFLTGMWHGASWNFICWGLYFGLIVMLEKHTILKWHIPRPLLHVYSLLAVIIGWGFFYFDDFGRMGQFFRGFFGLNSSQGLPLEVESLIADNFWVWVAALVLCLPIRPMLKSKAETLVARPGGMGSAVAGFTLQAVRAAISIAILALCVILLVGATNNAFIYTRF